jgi:alkylhydroperoxidase family enzyme
MLYSLIARRLDVAERTLGEPLDYLRFMARSSMRAFLDFAFRSPTAWRRRSLPREAYHVARLAAVRSEDCGPCVQTAVNIALADGVRPELLEIAVGPHPETLDAALAEVYAFAFAVAGNTGDEERHREGMRARYGDEGLVELGLAIAGARVYPTLKRALGYAQSCALVHVRV